MKIQESKKIIGGCAL